MNDPKQAMGNACILMIFIINIIIKTHLISFRERHTECLGEWACGGNDSEYNQYNFILTNE